jgi:hypothetical protein
MAAPIKFKSGLQNAKRLLQSSTAPANVDMLPYTSARLRLINNIGRDVAQTVSRQLSTGTARGDVMCFLLGTNITHHVF